MNKKNSLDSYYKNDEWYHLIPIILIVIIAPLIVRLKVIDLSGVTYEYWTGQKQNFDFFSYYKMTWVLFLSGISALMLLIKYFQSSLKFKKTWAYYAFMIFYILCVIISTLTSSYKNVALNGFVDRYEGMYVIIAYMIILLTVINLAENKKHVKIIIVSTLIGVTIVCTIGLFQYMGLDIWKSEFGKSLMLPSQYINFADKLQFQFAKYQIYSTLYHYNYVGSYTAMFFPLTLAMFILTKKKVLKIIMFLLTLLIGINLVGSNARSAIIGTSFGIIILIIVLNKYIIMNWKMFLIGLSALIIVFFGLNFYSHGKIYSRVKTLLVDITSLSSKTESTADSMENIPLKDISINDKDVSIKTNSEVLNFKVGKGELTFFDENNKSIDSKIDNSTGTISILNDRYKDYKIALKKVSVYTALEIIKGQIRLYVDITNGQPRFIDTKGNTVDLKPVETWGFKGREKLGSSRGYIWSRSIPLLKHTLLFGHGPDTFAIYFPQNDLKGKMYAYDGDMWQVVDKPHDMYLQAAINTGVLSLIALLGLFTLYFIDSIKIYFNSDYKEFISVAGLSIFVGVCGYLGAGIFNDSVVSVAPLFWVLLGMGISINDQIKKHV